MASSRPVLQHARYARTRGNASQFTVALVYLIHRRSILGAILMTGFLRGAEAIQTRVSGSGAFLIVLPVALGVLAWAGVRLRDERLRDLIPLWTSPTRP